MDEEFLRDLFRSLPAISIRRLFGGQGIYSDGRIVAIVIRGNLYLKSDPESEASYAGAGLERWTYARAGKAPVSMPYWRFPEDGYDDPDEAERWIAVADQSARRVEMAEAGKRVAASKRGRAGRKPT